MAGEIKELILEGVLQIPNTKEKTIKGSKAFKEALDWLEFVRPTSFNFVSGEEEGEYFVKITYTKVRR